MRALRHALLSSMALWSATANIGIIYQDEEKMKDKNTQDKHQSPIDIVDSANGGTIIQVKGDKKFAYKYGELHYSDGVAVGKYGAKFEFKDQQGYLTTSASDLYYETFPDDKEDVSSMTFKCKSFSFYSGVNHADVTRMGSEHTFNGKHFPLELHIVHENESPNTQAYFKAAVIGVMFKVVDTKDETFADKFIQGLFTGNPMPEEKVHPQRDFIDHLNLMNRYVYRGSLTAPPYSEYLLWNMVPKVLQINLTTLKMFRHKMPLDNQDKTEVTWGQANRDIQKLNGRRIFEIVDPNWTPAANAKATK